ncbi:MAG TPA: histidine kinase [Flavipsychrobacter sp.]
MTDLPAIIIGIIAMLAMASGIIFFVVLYQRRVIKHQQELNELNKQKELELVQASVQGEEKERTRIASELHDDVGATLASVKLFLNSQNKEFGDRPVFVQSRALIDDTINKVRSLSHRLQPAVLKQFGLDAALKTFFESFSTTGQLKVVYHPAELPRMTEDKELAVYRVVQELMNNSIKHSDAAHISCSCSVAGNHFITSFSHDGTGLTESDFNEQLYKKNAIGLKNIITRLKSVGGSISFEHEAGFYTTTIAIPL